MGTDSYVATGSRIAPPATGWRGLQGGGPPPASAEERTVQPEQQDGDDDRSDPGDPVVPREDRLPQEAPDDGSDRPEDDRRHDAQVLSPGHQQTRDRADDETGHRVDD